MTGEPIILVPSFKISVKVKILRSHTALQNTTAQIMLKGGSDSQAIYEENRGMANGTVRVPNDTN